MAHDSGAVRFIVYCADKSSNEGAGYSITDNPIKSIDKIKKIYFFFLDFNLLIIYNPIITERIIYGKR